MGELDFSNSEWLLERALKVIPNGTQTFSKSRTQYPVGTSPLYIVKGNGSHVWDVDGNEFIDFVSGLGAIIIGYNDPDIDNAVIEQMKDGPIFSLPHPIEIEVAEMLYQIIPCAEMVRFAKNGSDVTSGAVRLARYVTGRDHVIVCSGHYHGWQDWFNCITKRNGGVPKSVNALIHTFIYNDLDSLHKVFQEWPDTACVIMEPMTYIWPKEGFLQEVKNLCHNNGAIFILDEMLTGFRFSRGGAQEYFDVVPDLACFGKAMGNGYPISAIVGKADIMRKMEEIHFSFTFGGDCIGLVAAKATMQKLDISMIRKISENLYSRIPEYLNGFPHRPKLDFQSYPKDKIFQFCYENGILLLDHLNFNMSHSIDDLNKLERVIKTAIKMIDQIELKGKRTDPLFQIRT